MFALNIKDKVILLHFYLILHVICHSNPYQLCKFGSNAFLFYIIKYIIHIMP